MAGVEMNNSEVKQLVVIINSEFGSAEIERKELGHAFDIVIGRARTEAEVISATGGAVGLLVHKALITRRVLESLPSLRAVAGYGIGLDNIDLEAARILGIEVRNVPDYCIDEVAEHAVAFVVASSRRLFEFGAATRKGAWGSTLAAAPLLAAADPVGLIGFGQIGRAVAMRLSLLGYPVFVWDPFIPDDVGLEGVTRVQSFFELASVVNHLSIHVPLTEQTRGMVNSQILQALGPGGHLVNTARGAVVDEGALLVALEEGKLGSASLDVLADEPPTGISAALVQHPRVTVTPHIAYLSVVSTARLQQGAARALKDALVSRAR
jgi:D-3-phosphoglycerate dehydrogenase